jgi:cytochrome c oxidase assembly protein subunit 11
MVGLAYASAPLYNLFCRVTGYDGTPLVSSGPADRVLGRTVSVRFDANVAPGLDWRFTPETPEIAAKLGETQTVFFKVRNEGKAASTGIATFNVQPGQAGAYFVKIQCFCFNEQSLQPGETMEFPVVFYVDPALAGDRSLDDLSAITLSYTYFGSRNAQPVTTSAVGPRPNL